MQTTTIQSASLHYHEGNSDKEYHAAIEPKGEGYIVTFAYGRRGNTLTTGIKADTPVPLETATKLFNKLVASKIPKGYQPDGEAAKPYQQTGEEGRDSSIRCHHRHQRLHQTGLAGTDVRRALPPVPMGIGGRANGGDSITALFTSKRFNPRV